MEGSLGCSRSDPNFRQELYKRNGSAVNRTKPGNAGACQQAVEKCPAAAFSSSLAIRRTSQYASWLRISEALHPDIFEQPALNDFQQPVSSRGRA
jgi:hypothetical protein